MVLWMRVNRSPSDWPDQLPMNTPPARGGAISAPFSSAPWQMAHLASNRALPCAAWPAVKTPSQALRAGACARSPSTDAPRVAAAMAMPIMIFFMCHSLGRAGQHGL